jgi:hypothetical protein
MADLDRTWGHLVNLARSRFPNDPDLADLATREVYQKEENIAYAQQEKLYKSYGEGMGGRGGGARGPRRGGGAGIP